MSNLIVSKTTKLPIAGDPCHFIVAGNLRQGTFVKWDTKTGNAIVRDENGNELARSLREGDGNPVKFDGKKLMLTESSNFSVAERFEFLENFADMTVLGKNNALVVAGEGGLGKTFTVKQRLDMAGKRERIPNDRGVYSVGDYILVKGHSTAKAMYRSLYDNREGMIMYDDCDGVVKDDKAVNVLKGALDSYDKRVISWLVDVQRDEDLPMQFEFKGKVIFLTNLSLKKLPQPLISRCMFVDVSMTHPEKIERMRMIAPNISNDVSDEDKNKLINFMEKLGGHCRDLNMRTFNKCCLVVKQFPDDWHRRVEYLVTQG